MTSENALKACPLAQCGGEALLVFAACGGAYIECQNCGLSTRIVEDSNSDDENAKFVTALWNTRASGWEDIATAPKDGTEFQGWVGSPTGRTWWEPRCRYNPDTEAFEVWGRVGYDQEGWNTYAYLTPLHWMPLPSPPSTNGETP